RAVACMSWIAEVGGSRAPGGESWTRMARWAGGSDLDEHANVRVVEGMFSSLQRADIQGVLNRLSRGSATLWIRAISPAPLTRRRSCQTGVPVAAERSRSDLAGDHGSVLDVRISARSQSRTSASFPVAASIRPSGENATP